VHYQPNLRPGAIQPQKQRSRSVILPIDPQPDIGAKGRKNRPQKGPPRPISLRNRARTGKVREIQALLLREPGVLDPDGRRSRRDDREGESEDGGVPGEAD
jgi:hypothetical protein